jgi:hypothetical protein
MARATSGAPKTAGTAPADAGSALAELRRALRALVPHLTEADGSDLTALSVAIDRIETRLQRGPDGPVAPLPGDDPSRMDRLIELAGPRDAAELLRRIRTDLLGAARQIEDGLLRGDHLAIRNATHVLIAVAGSVGALALEGQARALNAAAHAQAPAKALDLLARPTLDGIARLARCLASRKGAEG